MVLFPHVHSVVRCSISAPAAHCQEETSGVFSLYEEQAVQNARWSVEKDIC